MINNTSYADDSNDYVKITNIFFASMAVISCCLFFRCLNNQEDDDDFDLPLFYFPEEDEGFEE